MSRFVIARERLRLGAAIARRLVQLAASHPYRVLTSRRTRRERRILGPRGVESLEPVELGGTRQHVLVRGHDRRNPVLLYLHGGIDGPAFFGCTKVGHDTGLERHVTMVYWERRGTGKSWAPGIPRESISVERSVEDTCELVEHLAARFRVERVHLAGHSWGSALAMLAAARRPELFHSCTGIAQVVAPLADRGKTYRALVAEAEKGGNRRALRTLRAIGPPPYDELRHMAFDRFSSRYWDRAAGRADWFHYGVAAALEKLSRAGLGPGWMSPEYNLRDLLAIALEPNYWLRRLGERMFDVDLRTAVPRIEIPVRFLLGAADHVATPGLASEYYRMLEAPRGKQLVVLEQAGHAPYLRQPGAFRDFFVERVLGDN